MARPNQTNDTRLRNYEHVRMYGGGECGESNEVRSRGNGKVVRMSRRSRRRTDIAPLIRIFARGKKTPVRIVYERYEIAHNKF